MKIIFKKLERWFLAGIAVVLPIAITAFVLIWLFNLLDGILKNLITEIFGITIPGLGLLVLLALIFIIGVVTSNLIGRKITGWFQKIIGKIPLIKTVYNPVHKIISGLSSDKTDSFQKVVMLEFPTKGNKSIGFITNSEFTVKNKEKISVFIPTTPNPTNGFLVIVDRKDVEVLDITVNEGLNMVVSIGSAIEGNLDIEKNENEDLQ